MRKVTLFFILATISVLTGCQSDYLSHDTLMIQAGMPKEIQEISAKDLEIRLHEMVNQKRIKHGLKHLVYDPTLTKIAKAHSQEMAKQKFFSHADYDGMTATERAKEMNYECKKDHGTYYSIGIAENIFLSSTYDSYNLKGGRFSYKWLTLDKIARITVQDWMKSESHRKNILDPAIDKVGTGVAISADHRLFITQDFC